MASAVRSRPRDTERLARIAEHIEALKAKRRKITNARRGRPALGDAKRSSVIRVSLTPAMEAQVIESARALQQTLSDWGLEAIRMRLAMTTPDQDPT